MRPLLLLAVLLVAGCGARQPATPVQAPYYAGYAATPSRAPTRPDCDRRALLRAQIQLVERGELGAGERSVLRRAKRVERAACTDGVDAAARVNGAQVQLSTVMDAQARRRAGGAHDGK